MTKAALQHQNVKGTEGESPSERANCGNGRVRTRLCMSLYKVWLARPARPNHRAKTSAQELAWLRLRGILLRLAERAIAIREKPNDAAQQFQHETPKAEPHRCTDSGRLGSLANCRRTVLAATGRIEGNLSVVQPAAANLKQRRA